MSSPPPNNESNKTINNNNTTKNNNLPSSEDAGVLKERDIKHTQGSKTTKFKAGTKARFLQRQKDQSANRKAAMKEAREITSSSSSSESSFSLKNNNIKNDYNNLFYSTYNFCSNLLIPNKNLNEKNAKKAVQKESARCANILCDHAQKEGNYKPYDSEYLDNAAVGEELCYDEIYISKHLGPVLNKSNICNVTFKLPFGGDLQSAEAKSFLENTKPFSSVTEEILDKERNIKQSTIALSPPNFFSLLCENKISIRYFPRVEAFQLNYFDGNGNRFNNITIPNSEEMLLQKHSWNKEQIDVMSNLIQNATGVSDEISKRIFLHINSLSDLHEEIILKDLQQYTDLVGIYGNNFSSFLTHFLEIINCINKNGGSQLLPKQEYINGYFYFDDEKGDTQNPKTENIIFVNNKNNGGGDNNNNNNNYAPFNDAEDNTNNNNNTESANNGDGDAAANTASASAKKKLDFLNTVKGKNKEVGLLEISSRRVSEAFENCGVGLSTLVPLVNKNVSFESMYEKKKEHDEVVNKAFYEQQQQQKEKEKETKTSEDGGSDGNKSDGKTKDNNNNNNNKNTQVEKKHHAIVMEEYENFSSAATAYFGTDGVYRALACGATHIVRFSMLGRDHKVHAYSAFIGVEFEEYVIGKTTTEKGVQPIKRHNFKHYNDIKNWKYRIDLNPPSNRPNNTNNILAMLQGSPTDINKCIDKYKLGDKYKIPNNNKKKFHSLRVSMKSEDFKNLLADDSKHLLVQDRHPMYYDNGIYEMNRGTIKTNTTNTSLADIYNISNKLWKNHKITCSLQSGSIRFFCTEKNLGYDMIKKIHDEQKSFITTILTDFRYVKTWNVEDAMKAQEKHKKASTLTEDAIAENNKNTNNEKSNKKSNKKSNEEQLDKTCRVIHACDSCDESQLKATAEELNLKFIEMRGDGKAIFKFNSEEEANHENVRPGQEFFTKTSEAAGLCVIFGEHPRLKNTTHKNEH